MALDEMHTSATNAGLVHDVTNRVQKPKMATLKDVLSRLSNASFLLLFCFVLIN